MERETRAGDASASAASEKAGMFGGRMPDAQMAEVLDMLESLHGKPIPELSAAEAREQPTPADAVKKLLAARGESTSPEEVGEVQDRMIAGPGGEIPIRIYRPASAAAGSPVPVVLYIHGGGWVIADLDVYDSSPRALCNAAQAIIVSTHYRQAPEHKFPAAHEDCFAAWQWTLEHAEELGGDPSRVGIVGESAGGDMAAAVSLMARDRDVLLPEHQVLVYPIADASMSTESYREMTKAKPLSSPMMAWFFENYLASPKDGASPLVSLVNADLAGLPSTTIVGAELDPLRSEGEALASKLEQAGVAVRHRTYPGMAHEFFGMGAVLDKAKDAVRFAAEGLQTMDGGRAPR
jgi:acetyl esterase